MASETESGDHAAIRELLKSLTAAWRSGDAEALRPLYHARALMMSPDFKQRVEGREACVQSYVDFVGQAAIHAYSESEPRIDVWDATAVATYAVEIDYEIASGRYKETAHDVLVLGKAGGSWRIVYRTLIAGAAPA